MGRFSEESHTDLREWYDHCLDFTALKQRLVTDPPDPHDDHPSMEESPLASMSTIPVEAAGAGEGFDGMFLAFPDPATRVFLFHLSQEVERMWQFYDEQSSLCASELLALQDTSATRRHQIHRKLGGIALLPGPLGANEGGIGAQVSATDFPTVPMGSGGPAVVRASQEHLLGSTSAVTEPSMPRSRGRRSTAATPSATPSPSEDTTPTPSNYPAGNDNDGEGGFMQSTEDPYVRATIKRQTVKLYDTCNRLLAFKMLNYDACVRLVELHCRRAEAAEAPTGRRKLSPPHWDTNATTKVAAGEGTESVSGGDSGALKTSLVGREKSMKLWLLNQPIFAARDINRTLAGVELLYASLFCHGDVDVARTSLSFKASSALRGNRRFGFGYRLGLASVLLAWALWDCVMDGANDRSIWKDPALHIYRGLGNLVLLTYMWGINIWVWRHYGIDYERCLSLNPKGPRVDPCEQVWNIGCNLSVAFLVSFIFFYKAIKGLLDRVPSVAIYAHMSPLLLLFYMSYVFLLPWQERKNLLAVLWTVIISPFGKVRFLEGYVGDILTSVVRVLIDVAYALIYFWPFTKGGWLDSWNVDGTPNTDSIQDSFLFAKVLTPLLTAAPLWWRFQQNLRKSYETGHRWPHLGNALKYATAMSVALFGTFQPKFHTNPIWIACFVIATLYQYMWDIFMDWDLVRWDGWSPRLRHKLLYNNKLLYKTVAIVNLVLRFMWTITLLPENPQNAGDGFFGRDMQTHLSPFIAAAEIIRRTMWGFLRVENEHLQIYGGASTLGTDQDSLGEHLLVSSTSSSTSTVAAGSTVSVGASGSDRGNGWESRAEWPLGTINRGSGLDSMPYSRMDIAPNGGVLRRATSPLKAWCLTRVGDGSRWRLLGELVAFTILLGTIALIAWLSSSTENLLESVSR